MWTNGSGDFYEGECRAGDREATTEEIEAWQRDVAAIVPTEVSNFQLRAALAEAELSVDFKTYMEGRTAGDLAVLAWYFEPRVPREGLVVEALYDGLDLDHGEVDELFIAAALISL